MRLVLVNASLLIQLFISIEFINEKMVSLFLHSGYCAHLEISDSPFIKYDSLKKRQFVFSRTIMNYKKVRYLICVPFQNLNPYPIAWIASSSC